MPLVQGCKRRAEPEDDVSPELSPEPATHRRRTTQRHSDDEDDYGNGATQSDGNQDQMVKKLVRLALACEYKRVPIRRQAITDMVLGTAGRQLKAVLNQAQLQLRSVFGMEMVELPAKERVTMAQKRSAKSQSQSSKTATAYILISILPSPFHNPDILPPPSVPTPAEESRYISLYTTLISLISLSGGQLPDTKLERYLRRLHLEDTTPLPAYQKTENLLKRMEKEQYAVKVKENTGTGEEDVYWTVGPRGKVEVGEDGVKGFVKAVYGDIGEAEAEELERRMDRSLGVGETVAKRREEAAPKQKRGRKRKEAEEEEAEEEEEDGDD